MKKTVGIVGMGAMGRGVAASLLSAGFTVAGYDVNTDVLANFAQSGGIACHSLAGLGECSDVVIVLVVNAAQTEQVLFGDNAVLSTLKRGSVVIASSTVAPAFAAEISRRLAERGIAMIDAPVSGGVAGAAAGKLTIMGSGPQHAYDACKEVFEGYAAKVYRFGDEPGLGSKVKLINNLLCGVHIAVAAEAMALAKREGIEQQLLYDVITHSAGNSWAFQDRMPHVIADNFAPVTALNIFVKDLGLVLDMANSVDFIAPLTECAHRMFVSAADAGNGLQDDTAVIKIFDDASRVREIRKAY
jgi:3-hydroxyisobutyrate dehydrogenase